MTPMIRRRERQASGGFCASCSGVSSSKVLRTPREKREQILDEYERGGMSAAAFAAMGGLKYPTLASWVQQRRKHGAGATEAVPGAVREG